MTRICQGCGGEFEASPSVVARGKAQFCSNDCRIAASRGPASPHWQGGSWERTCDGCGRTFTRRRRRLSRTAFCSHACYAAYNSGPNASMWRGGLTLDSRQYSRAAAQVRRSRLLALFVEVVTPEQWLEIRARFGHRCPSCKRPEGECRLTMDHIIPLSRGGPHQPSNIQPLCLECNSAKAQRTIAYEPDGSAIEVTDWREFLTAFVDGRLPLEGIDLNHGYFAAEAG